MNKISKLIHRSGLIIKFLPFKWTQYHKMRRKGNYFETYGYRGNILYVPRDFTEKERTYAYSVLCFINLKLKEMENWRKAESSQEKEKRNFTAARGCH